MSIDTAASLAGIEHDYQRWRTRDLLDSLERSVVAEYLVGRALGCDMSDGYRPWKPFSLTTDDGLRVTVKSAAWLQSWGGQRDGDPRKPTFRVSGPTGWWDHQRGQYVGDTKRRWAHVHVFALLDWTDRATVRPLDPAQWRLWTLPTAVLDSELPDRPGTLRVERLTSVGAQPCEWDELGAAVRETAEAGADAVDPRWLRFDELVADGIPESDAYAEAFAANVEQARRDEAIGRLRADGYHGRGFDQLARAAWRDELRRQYLLAEDACRGELLNAAGRSRGIDPMTLWTSTKAYARRWASDELKQWWDNHSRLTYSQYRNQLLTGTSSRDDGGDTWLK